MNQIKGEGQYRINILRGFGHESRTLLNGITGPMQLIQSLDNNPALVEPFRIMELSLSRMEKFSLRTMVLADLLSNQPFILSSNVNVSDIIRHVVLDQTEQLDFFKIKLDISNLGDVQVIQANKDLAFHVFLILIEQAIQYAKEDSIITISSNPGQRTISFRVDDFCILQKLMSDMQKQDSIPADVDIALMSLAFKELKIDFTFDKIENLSVVNVNC